MHPPTHAFRMPQNAPGLYRVWYGMMQLPPSDATSDETGLTFGEIREGVISASRTGGHTAETALALGCSPKLHARELSSTCSVSSEIYCWHRCMSFTETATPGVCAAKNTGFNCVDQFDKIYREQDGHGDYHPSCTNSTTFVTPRPSVEQPTSTCHGWQDLVSDPHYAHRVALVPNETYFLWNVVDDDLEGKMVHNGLVGWLAIGIENVGGKHNGMNGARIVMGHNNPDSSEVPSIGEYNIHEMSSAFRTWKTPLSPSALANAEMTLTGCFSIMAFKAKTIYGTPLNITSGTNRLIWALTHGAYVTADFGGYAAYHSAADLDRSQRFKRRGHVHLNLAEGLEITSTATTTLADMMAAMSAASRSLVCVAAAVAFLLPSAHWA